MITVAAEPVWHLLQLMPHLRQWRIDIPLIPQSRPPMTVTRLRGKFDWQLARAAHGTFRPSDLAGQCEAIAVGTPITGRPPQSGRIEARTGLRMMPTSPRSPYHSVRRVFPSTAGRMAFRT